MPRRARLSLPGIPWHIIQRGNSRSVCFYDEEDCRRYLDELSELAPRFGCAVHAYVLMTNHVHLLLTPVREDSAALLMKHLGQHYVQYVNRVYRRSGTLWEGRFRSCLTQSEDYVLACYRYIELNPVRAGMVRHPGDYRWSSAWHPKRMAIDRRGQLWLPKSKNILALPVYEGAAMYNRRRSNHPREHKAPGRVQRRSNRRYLLGNAVKPQH